MNKISFEEYLEFSKDMKIEVKIGNITEVSRIPKNKKMIKIVANFGNNDIRNIVSNIGGILPDINILIGMNFPFVTNLEPVIKNDIESQAMILFTLVEPGTKLI